jgi:hypothetical protein
MQQREPAGDERIAAMLPCAFVASATCKGTTMNKSLSYVAGTAAFAALCALSVGTARAQDDTGGSNYGPQTGEPATRAQVQEELQRARGRAPAPGDDTGGSNYGGQTGQPLTRAEVKAALQEARRNGDMAAIDDGTPPPAHPPMTAAQIREAWPPD